MAFVLGVKHQPLCKHTIYQHGALLESLIYTFQLLLSRHPVSSVVTEDSNNGSCLESEQSIVGDLKSHNVPESPGSEPAGLSLSGVERDSVSSVSEPETTAPADASERSVGLKVSKQSTCLHKLSTCVFDGLIVTTRGRSNTVVCINSIVTLSSWGLHCSPPLLVKLLMFPFPPVVEKCYRPIQRNALLVSVWSILYREVKLTNTGLSSSLKGSQDAKPDPECAAPSLKEVTSLENVKQDAGEETVLKVHDKDGDVSKASEDDVMKEEAANNAHSEAEIRDECGKDGKDERVVGNGDIKAEVVHVMEKEDSEDDVGNRCGTIICVCQHHTSCVAHFICSWKICSKHLIMPLSYWNKMLM